MGVGLEGVEGSLIIFDSQIVKTSEIFILKQVGSRPIVIKIFDFVIVISFISVKIIEMLLERFSQFLDGKLNFGSLVFENNGFNGLTNYFF